MEYIKLKNLLKSKRNLNIFDFDNTLCVTDARTIITKSDGSVLKLTTSQLSVYDAFNDNSVDFREFYDDELHNPKQIVKYMNLLRKSLKSNDSDTMVLTARGHTGSIRDWLSDMGIDDIYIVGLNTTDSSKKAMWIEKNVIHKEYEKIVFYDDVKDYVIEVDKLSKRYPHVNLVTIYVGDNDD